MLNLVFFLQFIFSLILIFATTVLADIIGFIGMFMLGGFSGVLGEKNKFFFLKSRLITYFRQFFQAWWLFIISHRTSQWIILNSTEANLKPIKKIRRQLKLRDIQNIVVLIMMCFAKVLLLT